MASTAALSHHCLKVLHSNGIVLGFGVVFALTMNAITWLSRRYLHGSNDTQMLMTAKKSVKTGLVASAVVSLWFYSATILNSDCLTYLYEFAGLWWLCSGATCQIVCYAIMAIELKRRAPRAVSPSLPTLSPQFWVQSTILEVIRIRFGTSSHLMFFAYGVSVQVLITTTLLLGGSAALNVTTGASTIAMNYLIPFGVVIYTYLGGLKVHSLSDYVQ
ncbi:hypothetical protein BDZ45DRAFT_749594 [Acephala macrosclerotiorum]|nr:hypothetical protein BDZ45DRAFT_749594 [Acephala macrosclerotiorum]